ncbi:MAG: hypothetical protein ACPL5F_11755, partial [Moorellaceae bacterium]
AGLVFGCTSQSALLERMVRVRPAAVCKTKEYPFGYGTFRWSPLMLNQEWGTFSREKEGEESGATEPNKKNRVIGRRKSLLI